MLLPMGTDIISVSGSLCCSKTLNENGLCCWSKLPSELWFEVFSWLRPKSLFQLRRVSKAFCSIITEFFIPRLATPISGFLFRWQTKFISPQLCFPLPSEIPPEELEPYIKYSPSCGCEKEDFVTEYFLDYVTICRNKLGQGCFNRRFITSYLSLLPFNMSETDDFLGCFNGFILVTDGSSDNGHVPLYLCNPATKQCIAIPVNPTHLKLEKDPLIFLAFDPLDPPPHHYKIVWFTRLTEELYVFFSSIGRWIKLAIHFDDPDDQILRSEVIRHCVYLKGVLYLLSTAKYLLSFDLYDSSDDKVKAHAMKLPCVSTREDYLGLLDVSNRCLYYAYSNEHELIVWTFQADTQACPWLPKYRISINDLKKLQNDHGFNFCAYPCIVYAVDLREEIIFFGTNYFVRSYHMKRNRLSLVCQLETGTIISAENCFYSYSICLVKLPDQFPFADKVLTEPSVDA